MTRIVVLEDEVEVGTLLRDVLISAGYEVTSLSHPSQVERELLATRPDLFVIDIMLPGISGIDVAEDLRRSRFGQVPIIAMSASTLRSHMAERCSVFDATIRKPFDVDELLDLVTRCLSSDGKARAAGRMAPGQSPGTLRLSPGSAI